MDHSIWLFRRYLAPNTDAMRMLSPITGPYALVALQLQPLKVNKRVPDRWVKAVLGSDLPCAQGLNQDPSCSPKA